MRDWVQAMTISSWLRARLRRHLNVGLSNESTRDNWVSTVLKQLPPGLKLLDAGAGECQYKSHCGHLEYVSQDFSQYDGAGNTRGLQTGSWDTSAIDIVSDILSIPMPDESFDVVLCTEVLEHLPEPALALKEFSRLLKRGGVLILTAPFCSLTHFAPYHFSTGFNRFFYTHHLEKEGFARIEILENGNYFEYVAQELRRIEPTAASYCGRKVGWVTKIAIRVVLFTLNRLSAADRGSNELLNFGLHVVAHKSR
jgi:ubiquinone/menaquinone biosynthesis C-methylase UbiE